MNEKEKLNENDDNKIIMENITTFITPKFKDLGTALGEKPSIFKMMKIVKEFSKNLKKEYKDEFNRELDDDIKKINESIGIDMKNLDMTNMLNMLKKM